MSILEKFRKRLFVGTVTPKKREKKGQLFKKNKEEVIYRDSPSKKKIEKLLILEKFRKRLFVGTVPPKKKEKKCQVFKN